MIWEGAIQRRVGWVIDNTYQDGAFDSGYWHEADDEWKNAYHNDKALGKSLPRNCIDFKIQIKKVADLTF